MLNVMDLPQEFGYGSVDAVVDKACLDSIMTGEHSCSATGKYLEAVYQVLSASGVFFMVSHNMWREQLLEKIKGWEVKRYSLPWPVVGTFADISDGDDSLKLHYVYVATKTTGAAANNRANGGANGAGSPASAQLR
jgi:hypothetical protein